MRAFPTSENPSGAAATTDGGTPGQRSLTQQLQRRRAAGPAGSSPALEVAAGSAATIDVPPADDPFAAHLLGAPVQRATGPGAVTDDPAQVHDLAARGVAGAGGSLPHADAIQRSFGARHDVGGIGAFVGGDAATAATSIGAEAYATGNKVAFRASPDLHTAAHEAAHVVQQRAGVHLRGGVGEEGDAHERHADAVADRVVRGESAADLLDAYHGGGAGVQRQAAGVQRQVAGAAPDAQPAPDQGGGGPSAPAGDPSTIEGQLAAGGIHVVLARQSVDEDIPPMAADLMRPGRGGQPPTLAQKLHSLAAQIDSSSQWRALNALSDEVKNQPLTSEQATQLATAMMHNNREFMNQAPRAARATHAVGGSPDAPVIGAPIPFLRTDDPLALVEAMSVAVRAHAPAAPA
ncbi:MAG TPA: DUF4157 domain-containing protein, partial [Kofleriaceae bacterium]|nr:DUF4157 domain-containing protein [Kofleriaceae bacterium]